MPTLYMKSGKTFKINKRVFNLLSTKAFNPGAPVNIGDGRIVLAGGIEWFSAEDKDGDESVKEEDHKRKHRRGRPPKK